MKKIISLLACALLAGLVLTPTFTRAADQKTKPKPYTLKTCIISGDKLGEMGEPYVFVRDGREIKLCCKNCLKDFNKNPSKYLKEIDKAEAKAAKEAKGGATAAEAKAGDKK